MVPRRRSQSGLSVEPIHFIQAERFFLFSALSLSALQRRVKFLIVPLDSAGGSLPLSLERSDDKNPGLQIGLAKSFLHAIRTYVSTIAGPAAAAEFFFVWAARRG